MLRKSPGFTILELLVAIAIIGLISTIAIAIVTNSREEARESGARQFASQVHRSFGATEVLRWTFDNSPAAGPVTDDSGNGNTGNFFDNATVVGSDISGKAVTVDGSGDYIESNVPIPWPSGIGGGPFTVTLWAKSNIAKSGYDLLLHNGSIFASGNGGNVSGSFTIEVPTTPDTCPVRLFRKGSTTGETSLCFDPNIDIQKWHHYVLTHTNSPEKTKLYVDGHLTLESGTTKASGATLGATCSAEVPPQTCYNWVIYPHFDAYRVGADRIAPPGRFFNGVVDEVNVYSTAIGVSEIQKLYAEGLPRHKVAEK